MSSVPRGKIKLVEDLANLNRKFELEQLNMKEQEKVKGEKKAGW